MAWRLWHLDPNLVSPANQTACALGASLAPTTLASHVPSALDALPTTVEGGSSLLTLSWDELATIIANIVVQANPLGHTCATAEPQLTHNMHLWPPYVAITKPPHIYNTAQQ
ncbi:hypothetical protein H0H87_012546, partial [Tephrocybe sp. NHM501043]